MKMSKILALILALLMVVSMFAACGNNTTDEIKGNDETTDKKDDNKGTEKPAGTTNELAGTYDITMKIAVPSNLELDKVISQLRNLRNVIKINRI